MPQQLYKPASHGLSAMAELLVESGPGDVDFTHIQNTLNEVGSKIYIKPQN